MLIGTIALLFVVPALYVVMQKMEEKFGFKIKKSKE